MAELDAIPSPYQLNLLPLDGRRVCLETQRGCAFHCAFCFYDKGFDRIRQFSLERVKQDLLVVLEQDVKGIYLMDPVFNLDVERAKTICRFIAEHNPRRIRFQTEIRAERVDDELAQLFVDANVTDMEIGLQSSRRQVLSTVGRKLDRAKFVAGVERLNRHKLGTEVQLILGLPGDTKESFLESLSFVIDLNPKVLAVFRLQVLPGTELWQRAAELGLEYEPEPPHHFLQSPTLPFEDVVALQRVIRSLDLFHPRLFTRFLCKEARIDLLQLVAEWLDWVADDGVLLGQRKNDQALLQLRSFVQHFCEQHDIDYGFYEPMVRAQTGGDA